MNEMPSRPEYKLTTVDNPYDPFTQFDEWYAWDQQAGYHTLGLLARLAHTSHDLAEADQHVAIQDAIDQIVTENYSGMHKKVLQKETNNNSS